MAKNTTKNGAVSRPAAATVMPPAMPQSVTLAMDKTGPGDPVVLVKLSGSTEYQPCYARDRKARQIVVYGLSCEHVGEAPDGTWQYEQRAW